MIVGGQEFPNECPKDCPGLSMSKVDEKCLCQRCPIFLCVERRNGSILRPFEYRPDWAKAWKEWFKGGMKGFPNLII